LLIASPESKQIGTHGMTSMVEFSYGSYKNSMINVIRVAQCSHNILIPMDFYNLDSDEGFKSSSYLTETLLDPGFGHA
jgi:hypothetical protein